MEQIVHICSAEDWQTAQTVGEYRAVSLDMEGFIHCSRPEQIIPVANRFYAGSTDLVLLWIDPAKLNHELRWEASDGDIYPHLYGPLNLEAVKAVSAFPADAEGVFRTIPELTL